MNRTAFFLGLSGAVVVLGAAAAVAGAGGAAAALVGGAAMNGAFSLAKDLLKDRFKDWVKSPPEDPGKLFANGHLTQLIGEAIQVVLTRERDESKGQFRVQLDRLLKPVVGYWQANYPRLTDGSLEEAHAANLTEVLHRQIQDMEDFPLATVEAWEDFLRDYACEKKVNLEDEPCRRAAERLHCELGHALYEKAKQAAETNPRAAAALQLQFQSWLLQGIAELHDDVRAGFADQTRQLARLHAQLLQSEAEFRRLAEEIRDFLPIVRDSLAVIARLEQAFGQLGQEVAAVRKISERIEQVVIEIRTDVRELKGPVIETHADVREIKPLVQSLHGMVSRGVGGAAAPVALADEELFAVFRPYLGAVARDCENLVTRGLGTLANLTTGEPLKLAPVYIALETKSQRDNDGARARHGRINPLEEDGDRRPLNVVEALFAEGARRIVLTGAPGSGKSTFLQFVTLYLADRASQPDGVSRCCAGVEIPPLLERQRLVPLRIILRDFAPASPGGSEDVVKHLTADLERRSHHVAAAQLPWLLRRGLALVLFDGLDEVPGDRLAAVTQAIRLFGQGEYAACRMAVTCRVTSFQRPEFRVAGFPQPGQEHEIAPLGDPLRERFIRSWYQQLAALRPEFQADAPRLAASLLDAVQGDRLDEMSRNPFFLTAMAALHRPDKVLPNEGARLMHELVDGVLAESRKREDDQPGAASRPGGELTSLGALLEKIPDGLKTLRSRLEKIAYLAREQRFERRANQETQVHDALLVAHLFADLNLSPADQQAVLRSLRERAGLLQAAQATAASTARLRHRSEPEPLEFAYRFEEFLAGCHLANDDEWEEMDFAERTFQLWQIQADHARKVILWAAGVKVHVAANQKRDVRELLQKLMEPDAQAASLPLENLMLAVEIAVDARVEDWLDAQGRAARPVLTAIRQSLEQVRDSREPVKVRAQAASALGRLGDPRLGVMPKAPFSRENPLFAWCELPAPGPRGFKMGEGREGFDCTRIRQGFRLARYPLTVAQYALFVAEGGYGDFREEPPSWWAAAGEWQGFQGWDWIKQEQVTGPENASDPAFQTPNHPRIGVSWFEAVAFVRWLNQRFTPEQLGLPAGWRVRLPTEAEWEYAASAGGTRRYPWGVEEDGPNRCNCRETGLNQTSAVGLFPQGRAACGAEDLAGNVWEWGSSRWQGSYTGYNELPIQKLEGVAGNDDRVVRGGAWINFSDRVRASSRLRNRPGNRNNGLGFRLAASPISGL